ncbi:TIGR00341 family protein [Psychromonas aquimarina]|uniref:TIGR00341 family protein n=1 Tax=Psychromonas aquimarina TaxID=444919 RepID=UPI0004017925|nr:TIGR00341 family protein [Psychromonas aquimarina]
MEDCFLVFDKEKKDHVSSTVLALFNEAVLPRVWSTKNAVSFAPQSRVFAYVNDQQAPAVIEAAVKGNWHLALLPHPDAGYSRRGFCIQKDLQKSITDAENALPKKVDILRCNGELVLSSVVLGHGFNLRPDGQSSIRQEQLKKNWYNIRHINDFVPQKLSFSTANEGSFSTSAVGVVIAEHIHGSSLPGNILSDSHINDGMCHTMILAPRSIMEMLLFFVTVPFRGVTKQPEFLGLVKTQSITVANNKKLSFTIDGRAKTASELVIESEPRVLNLLAGEDLPLSESAPSSKEQRKITRLPAGEAVTAMAGKPLPFIAHAATEEFKELYQLLRENAVVSPVFLTLMVLSTLLATIGLYASSAPVIIGAMILAPLMAPIISLAMALTRQDAGLLTGSLKTLFTGLCTALCFASFASFIMPMEIITPEISNRLSPSLLDLGVAVISGVAGAYAHARISAAKSMAGVAIAVALVPPLAVTGIGLGWLDFHVAWGALLLFLTNLAGIVFAASLTFLALGFAPFTRAKKGLSIALTAVIVVSIPLLLSFNRLSDEAEIVQKLQGQVIGNAAIRDIRARAVEPLQLSIQLVTPTSLTDVDLDSVKQAIETKLGRKVIMEAQVIIRRE